MTPPTEALIEDATIVALVIVVIFLVARERRRLYRRMFDMQERHRAELGDFKARSDQYLYQRIAEEATRLTGVDGGARLLVYAEIRDGNDSVDLLYRESNGKVREVPASPLLGVLVQEVWRRWAADGTESWRTMEFVVDLGGDGGGDYNAHVTYPEDVDESEATDVRISRAINKYFPGDWVMPHGIPVEALYPAISEEAISLAGEDRSTKILVYAEAKEGTSSTDLIYRKRNGDLQTKSAPPDLSALVHELWERWEDMRYPEQWRVLCCVLDLSEDQKERNMHIDLAYPEQVDESEEIGERRARTIKKYFG